MKDARTHAEALEVQREAIRSIASEADLAHLRSGKGGSTRAMSEGRKPEAIEFAAPLSDLTAPRRLENRMQKRDLQRLAQAIRSQVARFSDRRLNDGDDIWREREIEYRRGIAETANAICVSLDLPAEAFAAACGLYVSDGRDSYSDCHPGELTWERSQ